VPGWVQAAAIIALGALLVAGATSGLLDAARDPERVRMLVEATGPLAPALFVTAFATLSPFGMPALFLILGAVLVWPIWLALLLSWAGAVGAGLVGFAFARFAARDWVEARLPQRLRHLDTRVGERPVSTTILIRLFFFLMPPAHWALGVSRIGALPHLIGTSIGMAPWVVLYTLGGSGLVALVLRGPLWVWLPVVALVLLVWLSLVLRLGRRRFAALGAHEDPADVPPAGA